MYESFFNRIKYIKSRINNTISFVIIDLRYILIRYDKTNNYTDDNFNNVLNIVKEYFSDNFILVECTDDIITDKYYTSGIINYLTDKIKNELYIELNNNLIELVINIEDNKKVFLSYINFPNIDVDIINEKLIKLTEDIYDAYDIDYELIIK